MVAVCGFEEKIERLKPRIIVPESCHWYSRDGRPVHEVPRAKPKKLLNGEVSTHRETTLADARKMILAPSVTKVGLFRPSPPIFKSMSIDLHVDHAIGVMRKIGGNYNDEEIKAFIAETCSGIESEALNEGKRIHAYINKRWEGEEVSDYEVGERAFSGIYNMVEDECLEDISSEKIQVSRRFGVGGTVDFRAISSKTGHDVIWDYKSIQKQSSFEKKQGIERDHLVQLCGYRICCNLDEADMGIVYISQETGETKLIKADEDDVRISEEVFHASLYHWKTYNQHFPEKLWDYEDDEESECLARKES